MFNIERLIVEVEKGLPVFDVKLKGCIKTMIIIIKRQRIYFFT